MTWSQHYAPLADSIGLSALVAALPVVTLFALLAFGHVRAHLAALAGLRPPRSRRTPCSASRHTLSFR